MTTSILRTADAISPVPAGSIAASLALFVLVYGIVFSGGIYFINRLIERGPAGRAVEDAAGLPNRPITGATDAGREAFEGQR